MVHECDITAREALVIAPSPLAGEGRIVLQRLVMGEGYRPLVVLYPSPISALRSGRRALSRKGRGRNNARRARGAAAFGA